ncbi:SCAN domain-containing protein 1 isoform X2 [Cavia porcellus]|uniref:SCAN domain-containing protein 1 isoform X2 n=1 Tax=Cavia porcellus TaxID=10141 RepID=UPI002FDF7792
MLEKIPPNAETSRLHYCGCHRLTRLETARRRRFREPRLSFREIVRRLNHREASTSYFRLPRAPRRCKRSTEPLVAGQRVTPRAEVMAATRPSLATTGSPAAAPPEQQDGAGANSDPEPNSADPSTPEACSSTPEPCNPNADISEANLTPSAAASAVLELPLRPAALGSAPQAPAAARSPAGPSGSRPGPETFRQRFRQFRYQDAAGPREAFRQLRELSRQWLRPDIRTKEQMVEMLVQEQLLAILPEETRARRLQRRADVRITG